MLVAQTILKDRYIIESKIGQGGFGILHLFSANARILI